MEKKHYIIVILMLAVAGMTQVATAADNDSPRVVTSHETITTKALSDLDQEYNAGKITLESYQARRETLMDSMPAEELPTTVVVGKNKKDKLEPAAKVIADTRAYEAALNELAAKSQKIVNSMPSDFGKVSKSFGDMGRLLRDAKKNLVAILSTRPELEAKADHILASSATTRQTFIDMDRKLDARIAELRKNDNANPEAIAGQVQLLEGVKTVCKRGQQVSIPLRDQVLASQTQCKGIFAEIEMYPQTFDIAIEACDLYRDGIGDSTAYVEVIQGLIKARENLRTIITQFTDAAKKAEDIIKQMPQNGAMQPIT
jgi:hypothetical protein